MTDLICRLCSVPAVSGNEQGLAQQIADMIKPHCESVHIDSLGNVIAFKRGAKPAVKKVLIDAHMDEVGLIVTGINHDGSLNFATVGGINCEVLLARRVRVNGHAGVIQSKPIHLLSADERKKMPKKESLTIDIGARDKESAERAVSLGDTVCFESDFVRFGNRRIKARAIDDRAGCAILIDMIIGEIPYDMYFSFTVQEEIGLRGAHTAAFAVEPDYAIAVESTTAVDIAGVDEAKQVCNLGGGAVVSFMDGSTMYNKQLYDAVRSLADSRGIKWQPKRGNFGGNNAGAIHQSRGGVMTMSVSVPCRYLHSAACVIDEDDVISSRRLVAALAECMADGNI